MTLLWLAQELHRQGKIGKVRAIFVNHNTRSGQKAEGELIKKFCEQEGIPFKEFVVQGLNAFQSNFEARAREERRKICLGDLQKNELLWAGHHIDDSFEWNFMQRLRSTNPKSSIGIPVRNKKQIRPFMCVTRAQIKRLARFEGIPYSVDPTNFDTKYDRNYLRHKIIPGLRKRYPKYLKFYVNFANFQATMLNMNLLHRGGASRVYVYDEGAVLIGKHFSEVQIQELLETYSTSTRGEYRDSISRMLKAIINGKKGPFHFSGGMEAYYSHGLLMIYRQGMKNCDQMIANVLSQLSKNALLMMGSYKKKEFEYAWQNLLQSSDALRNLPGLVLVMESDSICKTMNTSVFDPLFPKVSQVCKEKGIRFITFQKCLDVWTQKREKLPERLRLIPLYNLTDLKDPA